MVDVYVGVGRKGLVVEYNNSIGEGSITFPLGQDREGSIKRAGENFYFRNPFPAILWTLEGLKEGVNDISPLTKDELTFFRKGFEKASSEDLMDEF